jgi:hypothetical protein
MKNPRIFNMFGHILASFTFLEVRVSVCLPYRIRIRQLADGQGFEWLIGDNSHLLQRLVTTRVTTAAFLLSPVA